MMRDQIVAEMTRRPDAQTLIEWIDGMCKAASGYMGVPGYDIREAIAAYLKAQDPDVAEWCEAAAEGDHDWNENDECRECGMGTAS